MPEYKIVNVERLFIAECDIREMKNIESLMNKVLEKDDITDYDRIVLANKLYQFKKVVCHNRFSGPVERIYNAFYQLGAEAERPSQAFITELLRYHRADCIGVES